MNAKNLYLIHLGALCQSKFQMDEGFKVREFSREAIHHEGLEMVRAYDEGNESAAKWDPNPPAIAPAPIYDDVRLQLFGSHEDHQYIWAGYSKKLNTLCIVEGR